MTTNFKTRAKGLTIPARKELYKKEILAVLRSRRAPITLHKLASALGVTPICLSSNKAIGRIALNELLDHQCVQMQKGKIGVAITEEGRRFYEMNFLGVSESSDLPNGLRGNFKDVFPEVLRSILMTHHELGKLIERFSFVEKTVSGAVHLCFTDSVKPNLYLGMGGEIISSAFERYYKGIRIVPSNELVNDIEIEPQIEIPIEEPEVAVKPATHGIVDQIIELVDTAFDGNLTQTRAMMLSSEGWRIAIEKI